MVDILGTDPYPVKGMKDDDGNPIYDDISKPGDYVRFYKEKFPNRPVYLVLQGYHWAERGDLRGPTEEEIKNMAWQAICEGADGLDWFSFGRMHDSENREEWYEIHKNVFADVIAYEDIILSDEPAPKYSVSGGGDWLNLTVKRYNGKTYVFAVNNTYYSKSATLSISGADNQVLSFEPLEVKKIELYQDDFLSPEAELKTIGFSNGNETFEVATGDYENILYVHEDSGVINYNARISDGAKLYGRTSYDTQTSLDDNLEMFCRIFGGGGKFIAENIRYAESVLDGQSEIMRAGIYLMNNIDKDRMYDGFNRALNAAQTEAARNNVRLMRMAFRYSDLECREKYENDETGYKALKHYDIQERGELLYMQRHFDSYVNRGGYGIMIPVEGNDNGFTPDIWYMFE